MFELKTLSPEAVPAALVKAERYRLLNEPEQCESICEDVLRTDPGNRAAHVMLILAITDSFRRNTDGAARAQALVEAMPDGHDRHYYEGLVAERRARALLSQDGMGGGQAGSQWLLQAMRAYDRADALRSPGNDDARLRWNACARILNARPDLLDTVDDQATPLMLE